jgi:hypothetical protein
MSLSRCPRAASLPSQRIAVGAKDRFDPTSAKERGRIPEQTRRIVLTLGYPQAIELEGGGQTAPPDIDPTE